MSISKILSRQLRTLTQPFSPSSSPLLHSLSHLNNLQNALCDHPFHAGYPVLGSISRKFHGSLMSAQVIDVSNPPKTPHLTDQTINGSQKICKLLTNLPKNTSIELVLNDCGVEVTPELVLMVLENLSNAGVLALGFFRWAQKQNGFQYTTEIYTALIDSLGKIRQFKMIWVLVDSMNNKGLLTKNTFNLIVRRYARAKKVNEAVQTFDKMEKYGMKLDLSDFNRFLDTMCKSRQVEKAHQVFDKMKRRRFTPDKISYTILLEGWGQQQNLLKLDEVYREMIAEGFEPDVVAYGIVMNTFCKARKVAQALEKFDELVANGIEPSAHIYCILINGLGSEKRLGDALKFFEMSKANGVDPEAPIYNAVVGSYCWSLRFSEAFRMVDEMKRRGVGPNSRTFDIILHHLIKAGKYEEVHSVFQSMSNEKGCAPTLSTYEIIVRMFCNNGQLNMAIQVWDQMKAKGILPGMHMFATMINSFCHANKLENACKYFLGMMDLGIRPPASVFNRLRLTLLAEGKKGTVVLFTKKLEALRNNSQLPSVTDAYSARFCAYK